jgi:anti-sigma regulatory factor (Ser/Thr protein kinase)
MSLELEFAAIPEGVTSARSAITVLCERLQLADDVVMRVRIAVNEACISCVQHAYTGNRQESTYMLETRVADDALLVIVHDYGIGTTSGQPSSNAGLGLGMKLIEKLTDGTHISTRPGRGTRIAMRFATPAGLA